MKIPKKVLDLPWPEHYESGGKKGFKVYTQYVIENHERLLVVTFMRNRKNKNIKIAPDFRYVLSKKQPAAVVVYGVTQKKARVGLKEALGDWGIHSSWCYPEIQEADEKRLSQWIGKPMDKTTNHMMPELENWISIAIREESLKERKARGEIMDDEVTLCPEELPEGMEDFIRKEVLPNDYVLIYKKGNVRGRCYSCGKTVRANKQRFLQNYVTRCPNCGQVVTCYLETSDRFKVDYVQNIASVQKGRDGETVFVRLWHLCRDPEAKWTDIPEHLKEIARWAIRGKKVAKWLKEEKANWYMNCKRYSLDKWYRTEKPSVIYDGYYIFYLPPNQENTFAGTSMRYCNLEDYLNRNPKRNKNPIRFLMDWPRYGMMEKLWKAGYTELVYEKTMGLSKEHIKDIKWNATGFSKSTAFPKRLLKTMEPEEWSMYYIHRCVEGWEMVTAGKLREAELGAFVKSGVEINDIRNAMGFATFNRIMSYLAGLKEKEMAEHEQKQKEAERQGKRLSGYMQRRDYSGIYRDYLDECIKLDLDLSKKDILFPKDLEAAHARTMVQVKYKADKMREDAFQKTRAKNCWMEWEQDDYLIRLPESAQEIIYEGSYLHHCVGGYVDRMADGKTLILFIRQKENPEKPFYTLEWLNNAVQQCRTTRNLPGPYDEDVERFVDAWVKELPKLKKKKNADKSVV